MSVCLTPSRSRTSYLAPHVVRPSAPPFDTSNEISRCFSPFFFIDTTTMTRPARVVFTPEMQIHRAIARPPMFVAISRPRLIWNRYFLNVFASNKFRDSERKIGRVRPRMKASRTKSCTNRLKVHPCESEGRRGGGEEGERSGRESPGDYTRRRRSYPTDSYVCRTVLICRRVIRRIDRDERERERSYTSHWQALLSRRPLDDDSRAGVSSRERASSLCAAPRSLKNNGKTTDTSSISPPVTIVLISTLRVDTYLPSRRDIDFYVCTLQNLTKGETRASFANRDRAPTPLPSSRFIVCFPSTFIPRNPRVCKIRLQMAVSNVVINSTAVFLWRKVIKKNAILRNRITRVPLIYNKKLCFLVLKLAHITILVPNL